MFQSHAHHFERNMRDAETISAGPAEIATPDGAEIRGIAIFTEGKPRVVIPVSDALRLAHEIADAAA